MNLQQAELYQRIQDFSLDHPHDSLSFSKRLARENAWTLEYTQRVIQEYKKLAFLAVVAGNPVSPSEQVDQAWHLHLTYTRSYWEEFCPKVLGIPLHHEPTRGGKAEQAKFDDWYNQTLKSYVEWFGESPPADIWPPAHLRFVQETELIQVDPQQYWVVPKLRLPKPAIALLALVLALVVVGCTPVMGLGLENPLNFRGPEFLEFYVLLGVPMVGFAVVLRWLLRYPNQGAVVSSDLSLYEIAFLAAGRERAVDTAIANLLRCQHLSLQLKTRTLAITNPLADSCHPLELRLEEAVKNDGNIYRVRNEAIAATQTIGERLQELGLLVSKRQKRLVEWMPALLVFALLVLGVSKIGVGIARHKPVASLVLLCLITASIGCFLLFHSVHRSHYGDQVLADLHRRRPKSYSIMDDAELILALALFGPEVLRGTLASLRLALSPTFSFSSGSGYSRSARFNSSGCSSGSSGSCGSSGCSSGSCGSSGCSSGSCGSSGCSSGGCGGGGCGGCSG